MEENENKNHKEDSIIPPPGEKWFTEFDSSESEHHSQRERQATHHRQTRKVRREPEPVIRSKPERVPDPEPVIQSRSERVPDPEPVIQSRSERVPDPEPVIQSRSERIPDPEPEPEMQPEEKHYDYVRRDDNPGAGFTMRTTDDQDPKKVRSRQDEYESAADTGRIRDSILRLRSTLTVRAAVLLFASVFSLFISIANDLEQPMAAVFDRTINPSAYIFTNTILGIAAVGFAYSTIINGLKSMLRLSPDSDSLIALNLISAIIAGLVTLFNPESLKLGYFHIYTSAAITLLFLSTLGKLSIVRRTLRSFDLMTSGEELTAVQHADESELNDLRTRKRCEIAYLRRTDFVRDMMKNSYSSDLADLFSEKAVPVIFLAALAVGGLSWVFDSHGTNAQEKAFVLLAGISGTLSLCSAASFVMISNRPLGIAAKKLLKNGAVMLGYSSAEEHSDVNTVVINAAQLLTGDSVSIERTSILSTSIDETTAAIFAGSLARAGGSVTADAFQRLSGGRTELVSGCVSEASMGVYGWIDRRRMMLGGRVLMEKYGITGLPADSAEQKFGKKQGVIYLAVSGKAVAMFSVAINVSRVTRRQIQALEDERVSINIRSCDSFIKQDALALLFDIRQDTAAILPESCEDEYDVMTEPADSLPASMFCTGDAGAFAMLLVAAKRVKLAANIGVAVQYGAMLLGIIISVLLMMTDSFAQITPTVVMVYHIIFMLMMKLLQDIKRL